MTSLDVASAIMVGKKAPKKVIYHGNVLMCVELDVFYVFQKNNRFKTSPPSISTSSSKNCTKKKLPVETQSPMEYPMSSITVAKFKSK